MLSQEERCFLLQHAYVPEHSAELIGYLSGGDPFLRLGYLCCVKEGRLMVVGYPLEEPPADLEGLLRALIREHRPRRISLIAPALPGTWAHACCERQRDHYYTLRLDKIAQPAPLRRVLRHAAERLQVVRGREMEKDHLKLGQEFVQRASPPERVRRLLLDLPRFVAGSEKAVVLEARDPRGRLSAFYVADLAPVRFATYVMGCHSKLAYVTGASDLLLQELVGLARETGKDYLHLGLGVSEGIRRFKEKWGARPSLPFEMCERTLRRPPLWEMIRMFQHKPKLGH